MQQKKENIEVLEDKALVEKWCSIDALASLASKNNKVPNNYFEHFESRILSEIHAAQKIKRIFRIPKWGQMAIAASFLTIIATTYLVMEGRNNTNALAAKISIKDITTAEIDAYISENEDLTEIDWQSEISKEGKKLASLNAHFIKDSNTTQQ